MSRAHRFFLTEPRLILHQRIDLAEILHQLQAVLRLQAGAQVILLDGEGRAFLTEVVSLTRKAAIGHVIAELPPPAEPEPAVTLYQCVLKADKFEWVLQKGAELGVRHFVPVISDRTIVRPAAAVVKKYDRWQAILREAAEQCGRGRIPTLAQPLEWEMAIRQADGRRLLAWEEQIATAVSVKEALSHSAGVAPPHAVSLLIGPEGGITQEEATAAQATGWQPIHLGPRILRAETAALTATVLVMAQFNQL